MATDSSGQLIHIQSDNKQWVEVCGMFYIHVHVFEKEKAEFCVQQPIISWRITKKMRERERKKKDVWMWTCITEEIFYPGSEGKALTQTQETR